jgi:predicted nucleic acid-binding protein
VIVVDTNVIAYFWLPGAHTAAAEELWHEDAGWNAPLLWRSEFRKVLTGYVRRRRLALEAAQRIIAQAESQMQGREYAVPSEEVLRRATESSCSAYDCEYVVLAEELGVPLVTSDAKLLSAFPSVAVRLGA